MVEKMVPCTSLSQHTFCDPRTSPVPGPEWGTPAQALTLQKLVVGFPSGDSSFITQQLRRMYLKFGKSCNSEMLQMLSAFASIDKGPLPEWGRLQLCYRDSREVVLSSSAEMWWA